MAVHMQSLFQESVRREGSVMPLEVSGIAVEGLAPLLQVFDMRRSIRFYCDVLGFTIAMRSPALSEDPDHVNWCLLELDGTQLMLNTAYDPEDQPASPDSSRWSGHHDTCIYFGCPDVDAAYEYLRSKGLKVDPPKVAPYGMKQLYINDPDGYGLCFQWKA
jgi:catechol 2,3-dioxygenase-like lactoylglutathione lyase family enzyme